MFQGIEVISVEKYSHGAYKECLVTVNEIKFHKNTMGTFSGSQAILFKMLKGRCKYSCALFPKCS